MTKEEVALQETFFGTKPYHTLLDLVAKTNVVHAFSHKGIGYIVAEFSDYSYHYFSRLSDDSYELHFGFSAVEKVGELAKLNKQQIEEEFQGYYREEMGGV